MTNLIKFDGFDGSEIRVTDDGRYSVFDVIAFCGKKSQSEVWKRLCVQFPEVLTKCDNFKFPGKGQRETPVASREGILYIIGLLPGAVGRAYREETAKVFIAYLDASPELAENVIDRASPDDLARIQKRLLSKGVRVQFVTELYDRGVQDGWQIASCTNAIYQPLLGGTAKEIKAQRNLPAKANLRENLNTLDLVSVMFAEELATRDMRAENTTGYPECKSVTERAARKVKKALE